MAAARFGSRLKISRTAKNGPVTGALTAAASLWPSRDLGTAATVPGQLGGAECITPREFEPRIFQGAFRHQQQAVGFERFFDKVVGAAFDGGNSRLDIAMTGDHHDRQFGMLLLEAIEQLKTVELAALQPNVEENEIGPASNDSS